MGHFSIGSIVYTIIGIVVANNYGYFADFSTLSHVVSAVLAVTLWPLMFIGVDFSGIQLPF
jgi:hypothetical protein